jgi:hypothetical protein
MSRQSRVGDCDAVGAGLAVDGLLAELPGEVVPLGEADAVCGRGLFVAAGRAEWVVLRHRLCAAVVAAATVTFCPGVADADGRAPVLECPEAVSGCSDGEPLGSDGAVSAAVRSGVDAACTGPSEDRSGSMATVSPPPTSATADAMVARRRFFFQRAI